MNAEIEHGPAIEPVEGFRFAGLAAGIKASGALDLALLVADEPCPTAAVFTRNRVRAAPVLLAERRVRSGRAQAVLVNSGNANAATGEAGARAAAQSTRLAAEVLDIDPELVLPASTGVIGEPLPLEPFVEHLGTLAAALDAASAGSFAEAILTTDRGRKIAEIRIPLPGGAEGRLLAMGKGAGMIHPNMATTLVFVVTDLEADAETLSAALRRATERTFNRISV
ncbi:MAG: bifunctional ornithine acetyltransferase/N-acetylglutamate synthase, partial [Myxococcales bacterium]|nr:bifunctional ornithine acetyltransferase/N-acetylglutamate synthase [Myxococcales bacterium]